MGFLMRCHADKQSVAALCYTLFLILEGEGKVMKTNQDYPDITCEHGHYPYCPLCEHGYVVQEEWMKEDQCEWVCLLDKQKEEADGKKE